jgi:hypothetical protein
MALALGPPEVGEQQDLGAGIGELEDRRRDRLGAGPVARPSAIGRLRSTRTSATLPVTSPSESRVRNFLPVIRFPITVCPELVEGPFFALAPR